MVKRLKKVEGKSDQPGNRKPKQSASFRFHGSSIEPFDLLNIAATEGTSFHWSQSAEDITLFRLFREKRNGFYIDAGAFHPRIISNTYMLHHFYGWRGINIDASADTIDFFNLHRPEDTNIHAALGPGPGKATYWLFRDPATNTFSPSNVERQIRKKGVITGQISMDFSTITDILDEHLPPGTIIDLLNIDLEGLDFEVLQSNDWIKYRPCVVLVEDYSLQVDGIEKSRIFSFMKDSGYRLCSHHFDTSIYVEKDYLPSSGASDSASTFLSSDDNHSGIIPSDTLERSAVLAQSHPLIQEKIREMENKLEKSHLRYNRLASRLRKTEQNLSKKHRTGLLEIEQKLRAEHRMEVEELDFIKHSLKEEQTKSISLALRLKKTKTELAKSQDRLRATKEKLDTTSKKYESVIGSRSWRLMLLPRKLAGSIRKLRGKKTKTRVSKAGKGNLLPSKPLSGRQGSNRRVLRIRRKLYELGFTSRPLKELESFVTENSGTELSRSAATELMRWYANGQNAEDAAKALELLPMVKQGKVGPTTRRQIAIIESECHELIGNHITGRKVLIDTIETDLKIIDQANLLLVMANFESNLSGRIECLNSALELYGISPIHLQNTLAKSDPEVDPFSLLHVPDCQINDPINKDMPLVTIIVPAYNCADSIEYSLRSILSQIYGNLEVIVVDDCSTDNSMDLVREMASRDSRLKILSTPENSGPYVARNIALATATGEFVTIQDSDDWSHPSKIEIQVRHLLENPGVIANTTQLARTNRELKFRRGNNPGNVILKFLATLLFRREPVLRKIGYWDCVRFGADTEYIRRMKIVFGSNSVVDLECGPLTLYKKSTESLTGSSHFGHPGFYMGARKEYFESQSFFHQTSDNLRFEAHPPRPFPVPDPMLPAREYSPGKSRHFDVILASEFRMFGGSTFSNAEEIKVQKRMNLKTGLVQMYRYDIDPFRGVLPEIRSEMDGELTQMLVYGEKASCDLLLIRYPPVLEEPQRYLPSIKPEEIRIIINQTPMGDYSPEGTRRYHIGKCHENILNYYGKEAIWCPIGPLVREALLEHHAEELKYIRLSEENWTNIIDIEEWKCTARQPSEKPRIGRHARDETRKWPEEAGEILGAYPDSDKYDVRILGGAETPEKILGHIPSNWTVYGHGEKSPSAFLAELDIFVYFTHKDTVESFGRVIIEAMASGIPVILPPVYEKLFRDSAIYCNAHEVCAQVDELINNSAKYEETVSRAYSYIEKNFSYAVHEKRLKKILP